ncbi:MAG: sulfatase-like hydrolase/transferase [Saccharolobus sp.]
MNIKPNIVVIMTDQQRADVSKREGFSLDTTPFLDKLAQEGQWFSRAYTSSPLCAPARISMLTGRFPSAHHVKINTTINYAFFDKDLIDLLRENGYITAMIGKNHSHLTPAKFDYWFELGHWGGWQNDRSDLEKAFDEWLKNLYHQVGLEATPFPLECQNPYRIVDKAEIWISSLNTKSPFFLWLSFPEPHNPYQVPEPYFSMFSLEQLPPLKVGKEVLKLKGYKWEWLRKLGEYIHSNYENLIPRARANYFGMLRLLDDQIKRFIRFLENTGRLEDTLIIFLSDHGDFVGEYGLLRKGVGVPEVLVRIPLFFYGPNIIKPRGEPHLEFVSIVDIMPTICEFLELSLPKGCQGRSLYPILYNLDYPKEEFDSIYVEQGFGGLHYDESYDYKFEDALIKFPNIMIFDELNGCTQSGWLRMIRKGKWKLVIDMQGKGELYDLEADPFEIDNLYYNSEYREIKSYMLEELVKWLLRTGDPLPGGDNSKYKMRRNSRNYWSTC